MQLSSFIIGVMAFSAFLVVGAMFIADINDLYPEIPTNVNMEEYAYAENMTNIATDMAAEIRDAQIQSSDSYSAMWNNMLTIVKMIFLPFTILNIITQNISSGLFGGYIDAQLLAIFTSMLLVGITWAIVSIFTKYKS